MSCSIGKGRDKEDTYEIHVGHSMICRSGSLFYSELLVENGYPGLRMAPWRRLPGTRSSYRTGARDKVSEPQIPICSCSRGGLGFLTTRQTPGVVRINTTSRSTDYTLFYSYFHFRGKQHLQVELKFTIADCCLFLSCQENHCAMDRGSYHYAATTSKPGT